MMLAILPASATIIGAVVLAQFPSLRDVIGIILVMTGVALHRPARRPEIKPGQRSQARSAATGSAFKTEL